MLKAVDTLERYFRWGSHYLRGLLRAHQLQQCTNFLDPGLQEYGGERFAEYRENGQKIIVSVDMPAPSRIRPAPVQ